MTLKDVLVVEPLKHNINNSLIVLVKSYAEIQLLRFENILFVRIISIPNYWDFEPVVDVITVLFTACFLTFLFPVSSVVKHTLLLWKVWGSIPGLVKSVQCRQRFAIAETFLRSYVALALSRGDGPRHLLHASA